MPFRLRKRLFFLSLFAILAAILVSKFILPMGSKAQSAPPVLDSGKNPSPSSVNGDEVGPELAEFDYGAQQDVYKYVVQGHSFTGTIQVINDATNPNPVNPALEYQAKVGRLVLRLTGITAQTTPAQLTAYAKGLLAYNGFPPNTLVVVGNELNNLDLEWKSEAAGTPGNHTNELETAAAQYAADYNTFAGAMHSGNYQGRYIIAPAPPDTYNAIWDPKPWIQTFGKHVQCNLVDTLVANVFQSTSQVGGDWSHTYQYVQTNICGKSVTHFAGYGANPDTSSIQQQITFYQTQKLPAGVISAATLIVDPCKKSNTIKGGWLYYEHGNVYTKLGNLVDPNSCARDVQAPLFIYPGIDDQKTTTDKLKMASTYIMTCASPLALAGSVSSEKKWSDPSSGDYTSNGLQCPGDPRCLVSNVVGTATINDEKTTVPLFRFENATVPDNTSLTRRYDDLQGFFSAKYAPLKPAGDNTLDLNSPIANGVNTKISPYQQQCQNTISFLESIQKSCDLDRSLPNPSPINYAPGDPVPPILKKSNTRCALDLPLSGTTESYLTVLGNKPPGFSCKNYEQNLAQNDPKSFESLLSRVEISTPKAFKPAYLVDYTNYPEQDPTVLDKSRNWFSADGSPDDKRRKRIVITKVYVPAGFATTPDDRSVSLASANNQPSSNYVSDFLNTMHAMTSLQDQQNIADKKAQQMDKILQTSEQGSLTPSPGDPTLPNKSKFLNCPKSECPDASDGAMANSADLESILMRRINAEIANPSQDNQNNSDCSIPNLGGEQATTQKSTINPQITTDPVKAVSIPAKAALRVEGKTPESDLKVRRFLLLPEEYQNVTDYENVLVNAFLPYVDKDTFNFSDVKLTDASKDQNYKYLQMGDSTAQMKSPESKGAAVGYIHGVVAPVAADIPPTDLLNPPDPSQTDIGGQTIPTTRNRDINLIGTVTGQPVNYDSNPQIPGGKLARGLWDVVCHVTQPFNPNKTFAPYQGFEKFLQEGTSACYSDTSTVQPAPKPSTNVCKAGDQTYTYRDIQISEGAIALALQVSKYTCTPAELLVGVLGQETRGTSIDNWQKYQDVHPYTPISGDPNQPVIRAFWCQDGFQSYDQYKAGSLNSEYQLPGDASQYAGKRPYYMACGPYSWSAYDYRGNYNAVGGQVGIWKNAAADCLKNLSVELSSGPFHINTPQQPNDFDARYIGQSMCITSAKFWASIQNANTDPTENISCSGANEHAYNISDVSAAGVDLALQHFIGGTNAATMQSYLDTYHGDIKGFSAAVQSVRQKLATCQAASN